MSPSPRERETRFETVRVKFPAIFKFKGEYFEEHYDIDLMRDEWCPVSKEYAEKRRDTFEDD